MPGIFVGKKISRHFRCTQDNFKLSQVVPVVVTKTDALIDLGEDECLEGTTERSDSNRVRSARQGEVRMTCLEGTTPQDLPLCSLIAFVRFVRPNRSPLNAKHEIRVDFFDIFGCARHSSNKFGSALACTKIREIRGQKIRGIFLCKVIPPPPHFQQKHPKTTSVFFSLKVVPESAESRSFLLDFHRPAPVVRPPRAQDAFAPQA